MDKQEDFFAQLGMKSEPRQTVDFVEPLKPLEPEDDIPEIPKVRKLSDVTLTELAKKYEARPESVRYTPETAAFYALEKVIHTFDDLERLAEIIKEMRKKEEEILNISHQRKDLW